MRAEVVALRGDTALLLPLGDAGRWSRAAGSGGPGGGSRSGWGRASRARPRRPGKAPSTAGRSRAASSPGRSTAARRRPLDRPRLRAPVRHRRPGHRRLRHARRGAAGRALRRARSGEVVAPGAPGAMAEAPRSACVGLVGERGGRSGRWWRTRWGRRGSRRSVVIAATSDAPAVVRMRSAQVATAVAEWFARVEGRSVLLLVDSLTRFARAVREVGLGRGGGAGPPGLSGPGLLRAPAARRAGRHGPGRRHHRGLHGPLRRGRGGGSRSRRRSRDCSTGTSSSTGASPRGAATRPSTCSRACPGPCRPSPGRSIGRRRPGCGAPSADGRRRGTWWRRAPGSVAPIRRSTRRLRPCPRSRTSSGRTEPTAVPLDETLEALQHLASRDRGMSRWPLRALLRRVRSAEARGAAREAAARWAGAARARGVAEELALRAAEERRGAAVAEKPSGQPGLAGDLARGASTRAADRPHGPPDGAGRATGGGRGGVGDEPGRGGRHHRARVATEGGSRWRAGSRCWEEMRRRGREARREREVEEAWSASRDALSQVERRPGLAGTRPRAAWAGGRGAPPRRCGRTGPGRAPPARADAAPAARSSRSGRG